MGGVGGCRSACVACLPLPLQACLRCSQRCGAASHSLAGSPPSAPLLQPAPERRRTVLLFVFRDRTRTPLEKLIETWEADLARMWQVRAVLCFGPTQVSRRRQ